MAFDFTSLIDRRGTGALAVEALGNPGGFAPAAPEEGFDAIPMWVADMNFAAPSCITDAIIKRAKHPFYFAEGTVSVGDKVCVSAEFAFAITKA